MGYLNISSASVQYKGKCCTCKRNEEKSPNYAGKSLCFYCCVSPLHSPPTHLSRIGADDTTMTHVGMTFCANAHRPKILGNGGEGSAVLLLTLSLPALLLSPYRPFQSLRRWLVIKCTGWPKKDQMILRHGKLKRKLRFFSCWNNVCVFVTL